MITTVEERNLASARRWLLEVFNDKQIEAVPDIIADTYVNVGTTERRGIAAGEDVILQAEAWAPDRRIEIEHIAAQGQLVMVLFALSGTHTGQFRDVAPTGKPFRVLLSDIFLFDDNGQMVKAWVIGKGDLRNALWEA
ncbi:ester cyclase [Nocardia sp. NPDC052278]|uniref:ester cyclase n=1 Tax=unclassified Nocardia TaxID=2637762 RepID=UPI0036C66615